MDGRLNCSMTAENAAFTKIRHLENRVTDTEIKLGTLEQETTKLDEALQSALEGIQEEVETKHLDASNVDADTLDATNITSGNITAEDVSTTNLEASTISVDNLENVNVLHGVTVDVHKTIADIGQFQETHTGTANNDTTNTDELNVINESNLTGQVNIDGNVTFTKDNGVSQLQGNYLEISASNITVDNKGDGYAVYAPGIQGKALFGGSVVVQDTLMAKNLITLGEVYMKGLHLDETTELTNPTVKGIEETDELTTTALTIDDEGKLVSKKVSSEVEGSVASSLISKKETKTYDVYGEWKKDKDSTINKLPVSTTAQLVLDMESGTVYLRNENGNQLFLNDLGIIPSYAMYVTVSHNDTLYCIKATGNDSNNFRCEVIPVNTITMKIGTPLDITQYFGDVSGENFENGAIDVVASKATYQPAFTGPVLSEDTPTICFIGTNTYLDLSTMKIKAKDTEFNFGSSYILARSGNWVELTGASMPLSSYWTNGKYLSIEDAALGTPGYEEVTPDRVLFYIDAPAYTAVEGKLRYIDGGVRKEVASSDILPGYVSDDSGCYGTVDKDGNPMGLKPNIILFNGNSYACNLLTSGGYYPREYISTTISYTEYVDIDSTKVEIDGSTFYKGVWYDVVVKSTTDLMKYITKPKDNKRYKVLFLGQTVALDTTETSQFPSGSNVYGTFDIYHVNDLDKTFLLTLNGTPGTASKISNVIDACHWHGFDVKVDILFCKSALYNDKLKTGRLHINDCKLSFITDGNATASQLYHLGISDSNNVVYDTVDIPEKLIIKNEPEKNTELTLSKCYNVIFNGKSDDNSTSSSYKYEYANLVFDRCDRCEANVCYSSSFNNTEPLQYGPGSNFIYNASNFIDEDARYIQPKLNKVVE